MTPAPLRDLLLGTVPETTALALGLLTLVLVGPGPLWVRRWPFLPRVPRAAVTLWQAGTVASLVAVTLAGAVAVRAALAGDRPRGTLGAALIALDTVIALFAVLVLARLAWSLVTVARRTRARRARHRAAVDLLGQVDERAALPGLRVVAGSFPLAYCLPSLRASRVVVSSATLAALDADELRAVLAHEEAHLRARHDVVLDTFTALHQAFPHLVRSEIPAEQCRLLVEMLADDAAVRRVGRLPLAHALVALAGAPVPREALAAGRHAVAERVDRLGRPVTRRTRALAGALYLLAVSLVASGPLVLVVVPSMLRAVANMLSI
ncbi:hypothetical protein FHX74_000991 [Friedmanniella endophytica]|uniref:Peptidase M48 domain-containing protein n=1 Tax=Microlunatus kandeliicorticis TaxID=1759536 RepID=A0A7W3IQH4_9ACTN|nr:M56 family metallopeptidase [Microlunatus kandeliicorticis]MBA8793386.1 hypothetical protein [Microlunatus kandeliicorticis]